MINNYTESLVRVRNREVDKDAQDSLVKELNEIFIDSSKIRIVKKSFMNSILEAGSTYYNMNYCNNDRKLLQEFKPLFSDYENWFKECKNALNLNKNRKI